MAESVDAKGRIIDANYDWGGNMLGYSIDAENWFRFLPWLSQEDLGRGGTVDQTRLGKTRILFKEMIDLIITGKIELKDTTKQQIEELLDGGMESSSYYKDYWRKETLTMWTNAWLTIQEEKEQHGEGAAPSDAVGNIPTATPHELGGAQFDQRDGGRRRGKSRRRKTKKGGRKRKTKKGGRRKKKKRGGRKRKTKRGGRKRKSRRRTRTKRRR